MNLFARWCVREEYGTEGVGIISEDTEGVSYDKSMHHLGALKRLFRHPSNGNNRNESISSMTGWVEPLPPRPLIEPIKATPLPVSAWSTADEEEEGEYGGESSPYSPSSKRTDRIGGDLYSSYREVEKPLTLSQFRISKTIGTGSFGRVFMAYNLRDPKPVAIKRLNKVTIVKQRQVDHVLSEKTILSKVAHPFIVELRGTFQDQTYLYIVMEYVQGGEFFSYLRKQKRLPESSAKFYCAHITCVFEYLHNLSIIYRDLKPENMLLTNNGYLKLADFGFAKSLTGRTYTLCGTPEYIAPEVLRNRGHGKGVDWWTLGILLYEMIVGYPPFYDNEAMGIYHRILEGKVVFPRIFPREAKHLVKRLLVHDTSLRLGHVRNGISDVRNHRWFADLDFNALLNQTILAPYIPQIGSSDDTSMFAECDENTDKIISEREERDIRAGLAKNDPFNDW